jgi:hypothetical protein
LANYFGRAKKVMFDQLPPALPGGKVQQKPIGFSQRKENINHPFSFS